MITMPRDIVLSALLTGIAFLPGCAEQPPRVAAAQPMAVRFSLDTPVSRIAADPRGKAVLTRDVPGLMASRSYPLFEDMSLMQIASFSGGRLPQSKLDQVQADLALLPACDQLGQ